MKIRRREKTFDRCELKTNENGKFDERVQIERREEGDKEMTGKMKKKWSKKNRKVDDEELALTGK